MQSMSRDGGVRYILGNVLNVVTRSRYGQRLAQNSTREINPARNFIAGTGKRAKLQRLCHADPRIAVDQNVKHAIERRLSEAQQQLTVAQESTEGIVNEDRAIREEQRKLKQELVRDLLSFRQCPCINNVLRMPWQRGRMLL